MIFLEVKGRVPSKSNTMILIRRGTRCATMKAQEVVDYETQVAGRAMILRDHGIPMFKDRVEMWIIWHRLYHDGRRRDLDNILKAIKDGLTLGKIWKDDSQVSHIQAQVTYDAEDEEWLEILL